MTQDLALEDPNLDAAHTVSSVGLRFGIIDVTAQSVERNAAFAIPFRARDFRAAETAGAGDTNAFRPKAQSRLHSFAGGEKAFGIMLSTLGGGFLLGTIIANWFKRTRIGYATFVGALVLGGLLALLGAAPNLFWACVLLALIASIGGFLQVLNAVWFQTRPDPQMLGRVMSVVMLFGFGLTPLSYVIAGALLKVSTPLMFAANGVFLLVAVLFLLPARRKIDETKAVIAAT